MDINGTNSVPVDNSPDVVGILMHLVVQKNRIVLDVILWLLKKGAKMTGHTMLGLVKNRFMSTKMFPHFEHFKVIYSALALDNGEAAQELMRTLVDFVTAGTYRHTYYNRQQSTLVRLAWQFGNEDNFFKKFPKDIINWIWTRQIGLRSRNI